MSSAIICGSSGAFLAGRLKFGVRWNTVSSAACWAKSGIHWIAEEPVPITATRCPVKSTPASGQRAVWNVAPVKSSRPGKSGVFTAVYTDTMEQAWQTVVGVPCFGCNLSSTAVDKNGIYVAVTGGNLYSLNRDTGQIQWA